MKGSTQFNILPMTFEDIPEIHAITHGDPDRWSSPVLCEELKLPGRFHFIAREQTAGQNVIAFIMGRLVADEAEIFKIVVCPSRRQQGVGQDILNHTLNYLRAKHVCRCFLELRKSNISARGLYEKTGFKLYYRRKKYYSDPAEDALLMEKNLQQEKEREPIHPA